MAFNGDWKVCGNDNFEAFLIALGVPEQHMTKLLEDKMEMSIKQVGGSFTIVERSCLGTKTTEWNVDKEFESPLADGSLVKGTFGLSKPNCLNGHFKRLSDGKEFSVMREVSGDTLVQVIKIDGQDAKRIFKKK